MLILRTDMCWYRCGVHLRILSFYISSRILLSLSIVSCILGCCFPNYCTDDSRTIPNLGAFPADMRCLG